MIYGKLVRKIGETDPYSIDEGNRRASIKKRYWEKKEMKINNTKQHGKNQK